MTVTAMNYDKHEDGLRVIKKGDTDYEYRIQLDRSKGLWNVGTSNGVLPARLDGTYTTAAEAAKAIKNYLDTPPLKKKV